MSAARTIWGYPIRVTVDHGLVGPLDVTEALVWDAHSTSGIVKLDEDRVLDIIAEAELREENSPPCSGPGFAHGPHGGCPGYSTDRT